MSQSRYLEISQISKGFEGPPGKGRQVVVEGFDLRVAEGEFVALIGHSGCGKSTVLSMIAGLSRADYGGIVVADREVVEPGPERAMVFQSPCLLPWMTALENVLLAVEQVRPSMRDRERRALALHHLSLVGLGDAAQRKPSELSAGMRQRVGLARAFACSPKVLLLDEPFGMVDSLTRMELQDVLLSLWAEHRITAVMVTHDVDEAILLSDRVVMMTSGPRARVGEILAVPFERPRERRTLLERQDYYALREVVIGFLEERAHGERAMTAAAAAPIEGAVETPIS